MRAEAPARPRRARYARRRRPLPPGVSRAEWDHPVSRYARDVLAGRLVAGRLVRLACRRHLRDLVHARKRGLRFLPAAADMVRDFFLELRHTKGEWAGKPIELAPWQIFVVGSIFGWKQADGLRRFRFAYTETGKKSGKSTLAAGVAILATFCDDPIERGAEGYTAATKREQAKVTWTEAREMVRSSPGFAPFLKVWGGSGPKSSGAISFEDRRQTLQPLGKDSRGLHGINPHFSLVDELHEHPDRFIWDILRSSSKARRQPLLFAITNAGYGETTVCWEQRDHSRQVLEGVVDDDSWFAFVACIDKGDDWRDPAVWGKANPSLGITVKPADVASECEMAKSAPGYQATFRRFYCGEWLAVEERAIDMDRWNLCAGRETLDELSARLKGREAFGGLDLSSTIDLTAWLLAFPPVPDDPVWSVLVRFFMPHETMVEAERRDRVPYLSWRGAGFITTTPSGAVDYSYVEAQILSDAKLYNVRAIGFDPCQAERTRQFLEAQGFLMIKCRQGTMTLGLPTRKMEALYSQGKLVHGANPVLRWCASNVVWRRDANNNYMPDKGHAGRNRLRIDGVAALVNALAASEVAPPPPPRPYRKRGVQFL